MHHHNTWAKVRQAVSLPLSAVCTLVVLAGCASEPATPSVASADSTSDTKERTDSGADSQVAAYFKAQRALAECFRKNWLPETKDPDELGTFNISVGNANVQKALTACRELGMKARKIPPEIMEQIRAREAARMTPEQKQFEIDLAGCMQERSILGWPDPLPNGERGIPDWDKPRSTTARPAKLAHTFDVCNNQLGNGPDAP